MAQHVEALSVASSLGSLASLGWRTNALTGRLESDSRAAELPGAAYAEFGTADELRLDFHADTLARAAGIGDGVLGVLGGISLPTSLPLGSMPLGGSFVGALAPKIGRPRPKVAPYGGLGTAAAGNVAGGVNAGEELVAPLTGTLTGTLGGGLELGIGSPAHLRVGHVDIGIPPLEPEAGLAPDLEFPELGGQPDLDAGLYGALDGDTMLLGDELNLGGTAEDGAALIDDTIARCRLARRLPPSPAPGSLARASSHPSPPD